MWCGIIFCIAVCLAIASVVIMSFFSPVHHRLASKSSPPTRPWMALSMYIQQPQIATQGNQPTFLFDGGAYIFHHTLTEGPENTSRVVGRAQGFIIPVEDFAHSAFNIIYLTFDTPDYVGTLSVQAKHIGQNDHEELTVLGGTGSFAFARGLAVVAQKDSLGATFHVKLQLRYPNQSRTIPG